MKKIENVNFSIVDSIDKDYEEFVVEYYFKNKRQERFIFIKKDPKYKKSDYLELAKKEFYGDIKGKNGKNNRNSTHKKFFIPLFSVLGASAIALAVFFISKNLNVPIPSPVVSDVITFDSKGGTLELYDKEKVELSYTKGTTWSSFYPENKYIGAVKPGYDFLCWSIDGSNPIPNDYVFNKPVTLKPIYVQNRDCITISCRFLDDRYTTPETDYDISFTWPKGEEGVLGDVYYAINNGNFNEYETSGEQIQENLQSVGDYFSFKSTDVLTPSSVYQTPKFSIKLNDEDNKTRFALSGPIDALTGKKDFSASGTRGPFEEMFGSSNGICSAQGLNFDVNHPLTNRAYTGMFMSDKNLLFSPNLPATTLMEYCYAGMFRYCESLITAPKLPAETMTSNCYAGMFYGCSSLTEAPDLPAMTLANYCYDEMFQECTSLITAPELPALSTAERCYQNMFRDCTSLVNVHDLPSLDVKNYAYIRMFSGCSSLVNAPEMFFESRPVGMAMYYMFQNCTSLKYVKVHYAEQFFNYTYKWLDGVSATGDFYYNGAVPPTRTGDTIPAEWTVHTF